MTTLGSPQLGTNWLSLLQQIRALQIEIMRDAPHRDIGLVPNPGASDVAIGAAEARLAKPLPPSYRAFLARHDGWPRFFEGATLLGTANLGKRLYDDLCRAAFEAADTPVSDGPITQRRSRTPQLIPFGVDMQGLTLFCFNPAVVNSEGEYEVIAWVNEIGLRRESFADFLETVMELAQAELDARRDPELRRIA